MNEQSSDLKKKNFKLQEGPLKVKKYDISIFIMTMYFIKNLFLSLLVKIGRDE